MHLKTKYSIPTCLKFCVYVASFCRLLINKVIKHKEPTVESSHNEMYTIVFVCTHFFFYHCFVDMSWHFHLQEKKEFQIKSLYHKSQAKPVTAQCQHHQTLHGFFMSGSELEK